MDLVTNQPIVVTGGNGFLGSHVIQQLLFRGYRVRATIRPKPNEAINLSSLYSPYSRIAGIENKLEFIEADLADSGIWESVITNEIEYVVHTANPFVFKPENPQAEILSPAVEGTRKILELCQASTSVKKFVYISCASALTDEFDSIKVYNESDWNSTSSLTRNPIAYR
jgi:nucleoside-diphosphate-sugar epimerase